MEQNTLGIVLSYYREKYNFSMEALCSGICSVATLHRVENGSREIDSLMAEALLGRVGKEVTQFELMLNDEDYALWQKREAIQKLLNEKRYEDALSGISQYREGLSEEQHLHQQICLAWVAEIRDALGARKDEVIAPAEETLLLTKPVLNMERELYNPLEIRLTLLLARYDYFPGTEDAENRLSGLLEYVERYYSGRMGETLGIEILLILINLMEKSGEDEKVIGYVDRAVALLAKGRGIRHVAELHYTKARAMERLHGGSADWEKQERCCRAECAMAYCVAQIMGYMELSEEIETYCREKLSWQITEQGMSFD